jgi:uncharacterized protein YkwD
VAILSLTLCLMGSPVIFSAPAAAAAVLQPNSSNTAEQEFLNWINTKRQNAGLTALVVNPAVTAIAVEHSQRAAKDGQCSNVPPSGPRLGLSQNAAEGISAVGRSSEELIRAIDKPTYVFVARLDDPAIDAVGVSVVVDNTNDNETLFVTLIVADFEQAATPVPPSQELALTAKGPQKSVSTKKARSKSSSSKRKAPKK